MASSSDNTNSQSLELEDPYQISDSFSFGSVSEISSEHNSPVFSDNALIRIGQAERIYEVLRQQLVLGATACGINARIESIQGKDYGAGMMSRGRQECFNVHRKAMEVKCGGNANVKYAWFGASKAEINGILSHGFAIPTTNGEHGQGVYLSPRVHPLQSIQSSIVDEDGLQHMLLCRVIMGNMEVINPGSRQCNPSSEEFDSGVDNSVSPRKYVIWSSSMNTRILPKFIISFRVQPWRL